MFRDSDIIAKNPHKVNQQVPVLQAISRSSHFDGGSSATGLSRRDYPPEPVPTTWDTKVDPTHKDADWAGLVTKGNERRHASDHRALASGLLQTEQGIVSVAIEKSEWLRKRREHTTAGDTSLIGGSGDSETDRWKTCNQIMDAQEPTSREQLTLERRTLPRRSLSSINQANTSGTSRSDHISVKDADDLHAPTARDRSIGSNRCVGRNGSMLKNIGHALVTSIPPKDSNF
jgi:hypothetical protein